MPRKRFPEVSVKLALVARGKLLVLRTADGGNDLPGGHLEYGESLLGALRRELEEEVGYRLQARPELFWITNFFNSANRKHHLTLVFRHELRTIPKLRPGPREHPLWFSAKEIRVLDDNVEYKRKLLLALSGRKGKRLLEHPADVNLPRRSRP